MVNSTRVSFTISVLLHVLLLVGISYNAVSNREAKSDSDNYGGSKAPLIVSVVTSEEVLKNKSKIVVKGNSSAHAKSKKATDGYYGIGAYMLLTFDQEGNRVLGIDRVMPGYPAYNSGIQNGDIIYTVNGEKPDNNERIVSQHPQLLNLVILRDGVLIPIQIETSWINTAN